MKIKDPIIGWFIRNIVIPETEIIKHPAFIICRVSEKKESTYLRELFLPEGLYWRLEKEIVNEIEKEGHQVLYKIGKIFGYLYSKMSNFPKTKKEVRGFIPYFIKYMEATYAKNINYKVEDYVYKMFMRDYIVCRYSGTGHFFSDGGSAGVWAWMLQDPTIEAVQPKCQGRGDKECEVIAAPYDTLVEMGYKPMRCKIDNMEIPKVDETYMEMNKIRKTKWARNSLRSLIDSGFFEYHHGQVTYKGERFFLCEASFMYILERELAKVKNGLRILWDVSFDFGKRLAEVSGKQDPCKFIMDFFPALGFGDILAVRKGEKYEVYVNYFPWLEWWKDVDFTMFRGVLSGVISGFTGKRVELKKVEKEVSNNLSLHITN